MLLTNTRSGVDEARRIKRLFFTIQRTYIQCIAEVADLIENNDMIADVLKW